MLSGLKLTKGHIITGYPSPTKHTNNRENLLLNF
jgi:hypothetical protein